MTCDLRFHYICEQTKEPSPVRCVSSRRHSKRMRSLFFSWLYRVTELTRMRRSYQTITPLRHWIQALCYMYFWNNFSSLNQWHIGSTKFRTGNNRPTSGAWWRRSISSFEFFTISTKLAEIEVLASKHLVTAKRYIHQGLT